MFRRAEILLGALLLPQISSKVIFAASDEIDMTFFNVSVHDSGKSPSSVLTANSPRPFHPRVFARVQQTAVAHEGMMLLAGAVASHSNNAGEEDDEETDLEDNSNVSAAAMVASTNAAPTVSV